MTAAARSGPIRPRIARSSREQVVGSVGEARIQGEDGERMVSCALLDDDLPRERVPRQVVVLKEPLELRLRGLLPRGAAGERDPHRIRGPRGYGEAKEH